MSFCGIISIKSRRIGRKGVTIVNRKRLVFILSFILIFTVSVASSMVFFAYMDVQSVTVTGIEYESKDISDKEYFIGERIDIAGIKARVNYDYVESSGAGDSYHVHIHEHPAQLRNTFICDPPVITDQVLQAKGLNPNTDGSYNVPITINFNAAGLQGAAADQGGVTGDLLKSKNWNVSETVDGETSFVVTINVWGDSAQGGTSRLYLNYYEEFEGIKYEPYDVLFSHNSSDDTVAYPEKISPYYREGYKFAGVKDSRDTSGTFIYDSEGVLQLKIDIVKDLYVIWEKQEELTSVQETVYQYDGKTHTIDTSKIQLSEGRNIRYKDSKEANWSDTPPGYTQIGTYTIDYQVYTENDIVFEGNIKFTINGPSKSMMPGVSGLQGFRQGESYYDYVYFGEHEYGSGDSGKKPIKFRVLDTSTIDNNNKSGLFLYSDYILGKEEYEDSNSFKEGEYLSYYTSELRNKLAGDTTDVTPDSFIFNESFTENELDQVIPVTNGYAALPDSEYYLEPSLAVDIPLEYEDGGEESKTVEKQVKVSTTSFAKDKFFLLPLQILANANYFPQSYNNTIDKTSGADTSYWTSSTVSGFSEREIIDKFYTYTAKDGLLSSADVFLRDDDGDIKESTKSGLRVATNISSDNVAFISSTAVKRLDGTIESGIKSRATGSKLCKVSDDTYDIYNSFKLTLFDEDLTLTDTQENREPLELDVQSISSIDVKNLKPTTTDGDWEENEYISAIITDKNSGEIEFYGRLRNLKENPIVEDDSKVTMDFSHLTGEKIEAGEYDIKLFVERYNGGTNDDNKTDYISNYITIPLVIYNHIQYELNDLVVAYDGMDHTIDDPQIDNINRWYLDVLYLDDGQDEQEETNWKKEKPIHKDVKRDNTDDVVSYNLKCKISIKGEYKDWNEFKYYKENITDIKLTIVPATPSYSISGDGGRVEKYYDGQKLQITIQKNILNAELATVSYSTDNINYTQEYPHLVDVKDTLDGSEPIYDKNGYISNIGKRIFFRIEHPSYDTYEGSLIAAIKPSEMQISSEGVVATYNQSEHSIDVINYAPHTDEVDIVYYNENPSILGATELKDKPRYVDSGKYTTYYRISCKEGNYNYYPKEGSADVIINEAAVSYQSDGFAGDYDREKHTISLILNDPIIENAKVQYIVKDSEPTEDEWNNNSTSEKPEFVDAGVYNVWFKISAENYKTFIKSEKVSIHKAPILCSEAESMDVVYDGMEHGATVQTTQPTADKATVLYSEDGGSSYTLTNSPKYKNAGTYEIYYKITAGNNYEDYYGSKIVNISKRTIKRAVVETISRRAYTGMPVTPSIIIKDGTPSILTEDDYTVEYFNNVAKGEAKAIIKGKNNYDDKVEETFYIVDADEQSSDDSSSYSTGAGTDTLGSSSNENASGGIGDLNSSNDLAYSMQTGQDYNLIVVLLDLLLLSIIILLILIKSKGRSIVRKI